MRVVARTVLIVDDHAGFRGLARRVLEACGLTVVGEAQDGASALAATRALDPELVLLDVLLPACDGFAVAERIAHMSSRACVVMTASREVDDLRVRLERTSACGFLPKDELSGGGARRDREPGAMNRIRVLAVAGVGVAVADAIDAAVWPFPAPPPAIQIAAHAAVGAAWIGAGLVAWARRPELRIGA